MLCDVMEFGECNAQREQVLLTTFIINYAADYMSGFFLLTLFALRFYKFSH